MPPVTGMMKAYWFSVSGKGLAHKPSPGQTGDTYRVLEIAHDAVQPNAEAGGFEFLCCGRPLHVDAACVADERFAHVEAEATEKQDELYDC